MFLNLLIYEIGSLLINMTLFAWNIKTIIGVKLLLRVSTWVLDLFVTSISIKLAKCHFFMLASICLFLDCQSDRVDSGVHERCVKTLAIFLVSSHHICPLHSVILVKWFDSLLVVICFAFSDIIVERNWTDIAFLRNISLSFDDFLCNSFIAKSVRICSGLVFILNYSPNYRTFRFVVSWALSVCHHGSVL